MICKHFGTCGGCRFQDVPYFEQLKNKEADVIRIMAQAGIETELKAINSFPEWYYRNKMEFTFSENGEITLGLHSKEDRRRVFNVEECLIFSPATGAILDAVRAFVKAKNYSAYNKYTHKGFLRHLVIREMKFTKKLMLALVTTSEAALDTEGLVKALGSLSLESPITSVLWITNDSLSDAVIYEKKELLQGDPFATERLDEFTFRIFIDSFFQTNPLGIVELYKRIGNCAQLTGQEKVLDLFCGVGSIGIFLAKKSQFVWGVEIKKEITDNAAVNAELNGISNISFIAEDVRKFLGERKKDLSGTIDRLVINPPRCGLSSKVIRRVSELKSPRIFYSSCNPKTLCENLKDLSTAYTVDFIEPFDFFPHTPHLECLAVLSLR